MLKTLQTSKEGHRDSKMRRRAESKVGGGHVELSYDWIHVVASRSKGGK